MVFEADANALAVSIVIERKFDNWHNATEPDEEAEAPSDPVEPRTWHLYSTIHKCQRLMTDSPSWYGLWHVQSEIVGSIRPVSKIFGLARLLSHLNSII